MGLNLSGMKAYQKDLDSRGGGNKFFTQKDVKEETDVRVLPPSPAMNGLYFVERTVYWINSKPYVSPATFGNPCIIERYIEELKEEMKVDADLKALYDSDKFKKSSDFAMALLHLDCEFGDSAVPDSVKVVDDCVKFATIGPQLMKSMHKVALSRGFQNGTEDGFTDRVEGFGFILSKKGSGMDTEYSAMPWTTPLEMDEKYYNTGFDVVSEVKKGIYPDDYLKGVLDNYFYGDPMPTKPKVNTEDKPKKKRPNRTAAPAEGKTEEKAAPRRRGKAPKAEEAVKPTRKKNTTEEPAKTVRKKNTGGGDRDLMKDLNNM